jgi:hexosaminidase
MAALVTAPLRLDAVYLPADDGAGRMRLRLVNSGRVPLTGFRLALTSVVQLTPDPGTPTRLVTRTSGYHELVPPAELELRPGDVWDVGALACGHRPGHANDGPAGAFVILADGSTRPVQVGATGVADPIRVGRTAPPTLRLDDGGDVAASAWATAAACERRLFPDDAAVLGETGAPVAAAVDQAWPTEAFVIVRPDEGFEVTAGSVATLRTAFIALARRQRVGEESDELRQVPVHEWRGLHIDVARQFLPAVDVEWLIDAAAWQRLNRLHLHLTDDEAWRVPIAAYPALTDVGAWRGHGLPIPALLGSGADPCGGAYTAGDIRRWVRRAAELGIELVPEVDLPGHCFAALAAVPDLRDPADTSGAVSVQHFVDNVLVPGLPSTTPFLEAVFGELADLFPGPWLHLGGDEVPAGAWSGSPAALHHAGERGLAGTDAIAAAFIADVIGLVRTATGRQVGVWQEAAECGALRPDDGYVVGWKSSADCRRLAAAGYQVVAAPAEVYYLDMASDAEWRSPGASWAGSTSVADIEAYDVTGGWTTTERANLLGIQACLWTEHVHDPATLGALLHPRLDAIAASAWTSEFRF